MHEIKVQKITEADFDRITAAAKLHGLSLRNYVRLKLDIKPLVCGNPNAAEVGREAARARKTAR